MEIIAWIVISVCLNLSHTLRPGKEHHETLRIQNSPVILIVYDAQAETAYWVYTQAYFERLPGLDRDLWGERVTIHLKQSDVVNLDVVRKFVHFKSRILAQVLGVIQHHEDASIL